MEQQYTQSAHQQPTPLDGAGNNSLPKPLPKTKSGMTKPQTGLNKPDLIKPDLTKIELGETVQNPNDPLSVLAGILSHQVELYNNVERMMQQKRQILVKGNAYELANIDQKLTVLAQDVDKLEAQRQELLQTMGYSGMTLKQVIDQLSYQQAKSLRPLRDQLKKSLERVQTTNDQTKGLLRLSLNWVADTVGLIANAITPPDVSSYASTGKQAEQPDASERLSSSTIEREA